MSLLFTFDSINIFCNEIDVILTLAFIKKVQLVVFLGTFPEVLVTTPNEHGKHNYLGCRIA